MRLDSLVSCTLEFLESLINCYNSGDISEDMLREHSALKLVFLKSVRNSIHDGRLLEDLDKKVKEFDILVTNGQHN